VRPSILRATLTAMTSLGAWATVAWLECVARVSLQREASSDASADVAIVLGAAVWGHARPSPVLERRLRAALALYERGQVRWVATTGGVGRGPHEQPLSEGEASRRWLVRRGVAPSRILVEDRSHNTVENLRLLAPVLRAHRIKSALIVSDGYHLGRALVLAGDAGLRAQGVACDGGVQRSLAREPSRRWSEARWLLLYGLQRPTARW
jgi:uncharacterized SAM-binding protein YcdF (DUF218 family)